MPEDNHDLPSLEALEQKIAKAKPREGDDASEMPSYVGYATRFTTDLIGGLLVGALVGYGVDYWFHTNPWFMLVGICLGLAAGIRNMMRTAKEMEKE